MSTPEAIAGGGSIEEVDGRFVLRFERHLRHPVERVWDALTRPERLREWIGEVEVELDLVEGGKFDMRTTGPPELVESIIAEAGEEALITHNTVLRVDPPFVFEHTFGAPDSTARWELRPEEDGCLLVLTHTEPPAFSIADGPRDLAGWHVLLESLGDAVDGSPKPWRMERWEELRDQYARQPE